MTMITGGKEIKGNFLEDHMHEKSGHMQGEVKVDNKLRVLIYIGLVSVFFASFFATLILPVDEFFKGVVAAPAVGSLLGVIYQIFKDQANYERQLSLQRKQQFYNLAVTSHMASVAFDKHVEFCEKYMREVHETVSTLFREGPTPAAINHANNFYLLRGEYAAWLTQNISSELTPFEQALRRLGSRAYLVDALRETNDTRREDAIQEMYSLFDNLSLEEKSDVLDENIAIESIKTKIRKILGIEELTKVRDMVISEIVKINI